VVYAGVVIAVIEFFSRMVRPPTPQLLAVMRDIGSQIGQFIERKRLEATAREATEQLVLIAATDPLTGLSNRRAFDVWASSAQRFAVIAFDVDSLKATNDTYGHEAGDAILRAVASCLKGGLRDKDLVARIGGDEFAALLPDADVSEAAAVAERNRAALYGVAVPHGVARITAGCAAGDAGRDVQAVWRTAADALERGKRMGRDRVEAAEARIVVDSGPAGAPPSTTSARGTRLWRCSPWPCRSSSRSRAGSVAAAAQWARERWCGPWWRLPTTAACR